MITFNENGATGEREYKGLSTDTMPTDCKVNSIFWELDTNKKYYFDGGDWQEIGGTA